jgi:hypothetical protein
MPVAAGTTRITPSALYASIQHNTLATRDDVLCGATFLAWGRIADLTALAARVAARRPVSPLA